MFQLIKEKYKTRNNVLTCLIMVSVVYALYSWIFYPTWQSDLDIIEITIAQGLSTGVGDFHILFSNFLLGAIFRILYSISLKVNWYFLFQVGVSLFSIQVIGYIIISRNQDVIGKIMAVAVMLFLGYESFVLPSYIKSATLTCVAAMFLFFYFAENKTLDTPRYSIVFYMLILSSVISLTSFVVTFILSVLSIELYYKINEGRFIRPSAEAREYLLLFFIVFCGLWVGDFSSYMLNDSWKTAGVYRFVIEKALGFGIAAYDNEIAASLGINYENYRALSNVRFFNSDVAWEKLKELSYVFIPVGFTNFLNFTRSIFLKLLSVGMFYLCVILAWIGLYVKNKKKIVRVILPCGIMMFIYTLLLYHMNALVFNISYFVAFMPVCFYLFMYLKNVNTPEPKYIAVYMVVFGVVLYNRFSSALISSVSSIQSVESSITAIDQSRHNMVDMCALLKKCSASAFYFEGIEEKGNLYVSDAVYAIIPGYGSISSIDDAGMNNINWIYNPQNITKEGMIIQ